MSIASGVHLFIGYLPLSHRAAGIASKETTRGELYRRSMLCIMFSDGSWLQLENEETTC